MKDLYTFDIDLDRAKETYALVCEAYEKIFKKIGIKYVKGSEINNAISCFFY